MQSSALKKQKLLELAGNGSPKPRRLTKSYQETQLINALYGYTSKNNSLYDEHFTQQLQQIRPDWIVVDSADKECKLIEMAKEGKPKPSSKAKDRTEKQLAHTLYKLTNKNSKYYNQSLHEYLVGLQPDWFDNIVDVNKRRLLKMAADNHSKPSKCSRNKNIVRLACALYRYTRPTHKAYDPEFTAKVNAIRPDWLAEKTVINKRKLLEMARNGEKKPSMHRGELSSVKLGIALKSYTYKRSLSYDQTFDAEIRSARPDWFKSIATSKRSI